MSSDFLKENIKKKPINKVKVVRKIIVTVVSAIIFGIVASLIILVLEPFLKGLISNKVTTENAGSVVIQEDEKTPEELLSEYMLMENGMTGASEENLSSVELPLSDEQINEILSKVNLDSSDYRQMATAIAVFGRSIEKYTVTIRSSSSSVDWLNTVNNSVDTISGTIIAKNNKDVFIIADSSRIKDESQIVVTFNNGAKAGALIKGKDANTSLEILSVSISDLPNEMNIDEYIPVLSNSNGTYVGMPVFAVGSPQGINGSIGYGVIDVPKQTVSQIDSNISILQTDILCSNSATGALFNYQGQILGIITNSFSHSSGNNMLVAYGITDLKNRIEKMSNGTPLNYLGISATDVTSTVNSEQGVPTGAYVTDIQMDSPAMKAGLQKGDVIVKINETTVYNFGDYTSTLNQLTVGNEARLNVKRKSVDSYVDLEIKIVVEGR